MVGKPLIKGTRLTVEYILNLLAQGSSTTDILDEYEGLTPEDIQAFLFFASQSLSSTTLMPLVAGSTVGLSLATGDDIWFLTGGFFADQLSSSKDQGAQGYGITTHLSVTPINTAEQILHLGGSFSYRNVGNESGVFFRNRPESGLTDVRYVNTGTVFGAQSINRFGLDMATIRGSWSVQGEYIHTLVGRSGYDNVRFDGWYVFLSWFTTGETRNYLDDGIFGRIQPLHDYGAVELAARYSGIDLNDADITGGAEHNLTFGLNWYIHKQLRIMANYIFVLTDNNANDNGTVIGQDSPHILQMRIQVDF